MRRFERLGFKSEEEYMKAPIKLYKEMLSDCANGDGRIGTQIITIDRKHYIGFMMFSAKEELYFLHSRELEELKGTPLYEAVFNCYEEVNSGYILSIEEIERLEGSIRCYQIEERRKANQARKAKKAQEEKIEEPTEIESNVKEENEYDEMTEAEFLGYDKSELTTVALKQELHDNYSALRKEPIKENKVKYASEMIKILEILLKRDYITVIGFSSYLSRIERELNKDLDA